MVNESERESIREEARGILAKFAKRLENVKTPKHKVSGATRGGTREEKGSVKVDADFRKRIFANAPHKNEDCIIAEKASW